MIRETEDNLHLMLIKVLYKTLKCKVSFLEVIKSPGRPHSSAFSLLSGIMATGPDAIELWLLPSGVVSFFILLLILSIFLTGLCSDCGRSADFLHHRMMKWMKMKSLTFVIIRVNLKQSSNIWNDQWIIKTWSDAVVCCFSDIHLSFRIWRWTEPRQRSSAW